MTQTFCDRLFKRVEPVWNAYLEHPFVKGIGTGELDHDKFRHYMRQDYVYLIEYSRLFAIGAAKSDDLETMTLFANLLSGTMNFEMDLHRSYAAKFGISNEDLENTYPSSTMTAYTSFMLQEAYKGGVENTAAAVLACAWSYNFIGKALAKWDGALEHEFYGSWVQTYSGEEFSALADTCINLVNRLAEGMPERKLKEMEEIFVKTSYYEYMFWDMAIDESMWPCEMV